MKCRGIRLTTLVAILAIVPASAAQAAELVTAAGDENVVVARQGEVTSFGVQLHAEGAINCGVQRNHEALASVETLYSIVGGEVFEGDSPSEPRRFFRTRTVKLGPPRDGCPVSWETDPEPYQLEASVAIASDTEPGEYTVELRTAVGGAGDLFDEVPTTITVSVPEPPPPPPLVRLAPVAPEPPPERDLPLPLENFSVNLLPVVGTVFVRYPGSQEFILLDRPVQVPVNSTLDTTAGRVELVSDGDGKGTPQSAKFWNGRFAVRYTRAVVPTRKRKAQSSRRAARPITELTLPRTCGAGSRASASTSGVPPAQAAGRRGLFGRGKGRFRTRGNHGAGTVRGTYWYTENRCRSTFFRVYRGFVDVRDFAQRRTVRLRRKQSYLTGARR